MIVFLEVKGMRKRQKRHYRRKNMELVLEGSQYQVKKNGARLLHQKVKCVWRHCMDRRDLTGELTGPMSTQQSDWALWA